MVSPGLRVGNRATIATTPLPNKISTSVPRNSAANSAHRDGFEFILSPKNQIVVRTAHSLSSRRFKGILHTSLLSGSELPQKFRQRGHFDLTFPLTLLR